MGRGNGLAVEPMSRNPESQRSIPRLGSRTLSIEHAELLRSTPSLVLCCAWLVTMALHVNCDLDQLSPLPTSGDDKWVAAKHCGWAKRSRISDTQRLRSSLQFHYINNQSLLYFVYRWNSWMFIILTHNTRLYTADAVWYRHLSGQPTWHDVTGRDRTWHDMTWRDVTWHDMMWHDMTWHDVTGRVRTWQDVTWRDFTWHDVTRRGMTWNDVKWRDMTCLDVAWRDMTWHDVPWRDMTWLDVTWRDMTWHDVTWRDMTTLRDMTIKLTIKRWSCDRLATFVRLLINLELLCQGSNVWVTSKTSWTGRWPEFLRSPKHGSSVGMSSKDSLTSKT